MLDEDYIPKTLQQAVQLFSDELFCVHFVANLRWPDDKAHCPKCGQANNHFMKSRRVWQCKTKDCKKQFSVKVGTIFEDSAIGLDKWLMAMWLIVNAKNGISSYELHRAIGITQKSAWFVLHRIRIAMQTGTIEKLSGEVEVDETYVGGKASNMHKSKRVRFQSKWTRQMKENKTAVFGMIQRGGKVRAKVIKSVRTENVTPLIQANIEPDSNVFTDQAIIYRDLYEQYIHETVNHTIEYVRGNVHTNSIENFWSLLKRAVKGTYVSVAPEHLQKYVEEQAFRFNARQGNDQERFVQLLKSISGKKLTYQQLIGYQI